MPKTLTRAEMETVLDGGGGVIHNGNVIIEKHLLPTEAELAKGDPALEADAAAALQQKIDALQGQLNGLTAQNAKQEASI